MALLYTGQPSNDIPRNVTHVIIDGSVKDIGRDAFSCCYELKNVELRDGLERIDDNAFRECTSLVGISIPSTTKEIGQWAFADCTHLRNVELRDGLERIEKMAFRGCSSLVGISIPSTTKEIGQYAFSWCSLRNVELRDGLEMIEHHAFECNPLEDISIPSTIKEISWGAFLGCTQLESVELHDGLELINNGAFHQCTSLVQISIPSTVNHISVIAFQGCDNLMKIEFCEEVEKLVSVASLRDWWNDGISKLCLLTYSFLVQHSIPRRLGLIKRRMGVWVDDIHAMLQRIHDIHLSNENTNNGVKKYFESIKSRLAYYEHLQEEVAPLLELAIWKSKVSEHLSSSRDIKQMKQQCRSDSEMMGSIIIPNALSFL